MSVRSLAHGPETEILRRAPNPEPGLPAGPGHEQVWLDYFLAHAKKKKFDRYLLLDTFVGHWMENALEEHGIAEADQKWLPVYTKAGAHKDPLLIRVGKEHDALLHRALAQAAKTTAEDCLGGRHICALLQTREPFDALASHLTRQAKGAGRGLTNAPEGTPNFRYFDPRVMHTLQRLLPRYRHHTLLGPVHLWAYLDYRCVFRVVQNPGDTTTTVRPLNLDPPHMRALRHNALAYKAMRRMWKYHEAWDEETDLDLLDYLEEAEGEHFDEDDTLIDYAMLRWLIAKEYTHQALLTQALDTYRRNHNPLRSTAETLSPELFN